MKPCTVDLMPLATLEQFEYQATNRLLLAALEEYEHSGTRVELLTLSLLRVCFIMGSQVAAGSTSYEICSFVRGLHACDWEPAIGET